MRKLFEGAEVIRKAIIEAKSKKFKFQGSLCEREGLPEELTTFVDWVLIGKRLLTF